MKPLIGITPSAQTEHLAHGPVRRHALSDPYIRAVAAAGGIPVILPPLHDDAATLVEVIDGLLLSGGPDIEPARFGDATVHEMTYGIDLDRDRWEIDLVHAARRQQVPVFGICRGIQVLNVAVGGTLIQDVATEHPGAVDVGHRQHERGLEGADIGHEVIATPDAHRVPIFDNGRLGVNSFHHQAIRDLAPGLVAIAHAPDGLIEAVAAADDWATFAVQWHPELMFERHPAHRRPFAQLVAAAAARKLALPLA
jgi:putative glutamine amidotransferase